MTQDVETQGLLRRVDEIAPIIRQYRAQADEERHLSQPVYDAMYEAGLFGMMQPKAHGGMELHPVDTMRVVEVVARIDSAAAWNLLMLQGIAGYAAWMTPQGVDELFRDGIPTVSGALNPPAAARRVDGGWLITGQCPFGSGCHHAKWLAMPAMGMDGDAPKVDAAGGMPVPFGFFFLRTEARLLDNWHTLGMRGTGSVDYAVQDLFVPDHMTVPIAPLATPAAGFEGPLYRMWPLAFGILNEAAVSVGVAAAAVEEAIQLCNTKTPAYNATPLREQQLAQFLLGKAQARVNASRDTLHKAVEEGYDDVVSTGALLSTRSKVRMQLAACFAADACAEAVRLVSDAVGTSAIRDEQPFERHFRDAHTLLQHSSKSAPRYGSAGRLMLGLENDWVWLTF
jgi:alkylation response protein AidB-like acyl-CoA dehydrogenase